MESNHKSDKVWINCFNLKSTEPLEEEELKVSFPGINILTFDIYKDKSDENIANILINTSDVEKLPSTEPPVSLLHTLFNFLTLFLLIN